MKKVTIKYGSDTHMVTVALGAAIGIIIADTTAKVILGYGDNVRALVNGVEQTNDTVVADGSTINLETRANQKAV